MFPKPICTALCTSSTDVHRATPPYIAWQVTIRVPSMMSSVPYRSLYWPIANSIHIRTPLLDSLRIMHHLHQGGVSIEYILTFLTQLVTGIWLPRALAQCVYCLDWHAV